MEFYVRKLLFVAALNIGLGVLGSPCSKENRTVDFMACKDGIRTKLVDPSLFWFGTDYSTKCPNGANSGFLCSNPSPLKTSISHRLFTTDVFSNIDRFLELHYESTGMDYTYCGNTFKSDETWTYDVDPTSDRVVTPWYVKNFPVAVKWNHTAGDMFTLIVYDVGYLVYHGVYVNIYGDDIMTAQIIKNYHGPQSSSDLKNPYIFLLFKQPGSVNVSQGWVNGITTQNFAGVWPIQNFTKDYNMTDRLVAVNWLVSTGDVYGAYLARTYSFMCPIFATKALLEYPRPFIPNDTMLSVWLDFTFYNTFHEMTVCCKKETYPTRNVTLNPIGNPIYSTWEVRSEATHTLTFRKMGLLPDVTNFTGDAHTIIAIDPDVPYATAGTQQRPLLHGMVTNIVNGNMSTGDHVMNYGGPTPPDYKAHYYYTLLYKQNGTVNGTKLRYDYLGNCQGTLVGRCLFDINRAVAENNLTLVGATWFRSTTDAYVRYRFIERGDPEEEVCKNQPGYSKPCQTSASTRALASLPFVCFILSILRVSKDV